MALVSNGFWLVVTLRDNGGNETTKTYQMVAADADTAATDAATVITALNAVTDAVIVSYFTYERFIEDAFAYPGDGVQVENLALLDFDLVDHPEKTATVTIPAPNIGIFVASSGSGANVVDTSDAALIAFRDLFRTGGQLLISDGEVAESLVRGRRIHRKSLRG
jgi:hypothetical protein